MMRIFNRLSAYVFVVFAMAPAVALAHFMTLIPSAATVPPGQSPALELELSFMHPFDGTRMDMAPPKRIGVMTGGESQDLAEHLHPLADGQNRYFRLSHNPTRPGDYSYFIDPEPYWEPAEQKFIVHQTKVVVNAFGLEEGWDEPVGLEAEIIPLSRPYGLWTGNLFSGQVRHRGKPVPNATIEVSPYLGKALLGERAETWRIQIVRADDNGVFHYAMPFAGWWGFAALLEGQETLRGADGKHYPVELGAVIWVESRDPR
ncbi:DUF4198 domain-containing protein [Thiosocius teredinicola]|uniref:DUF4198 domain-containing protein n=1 Tax=Thiosocius teredinicola TaxID=1973002 RepID=UPI00099133E6